MDISRSFIEGLILSVGFLIILILSLAVNPRIWLKDYPKDIQRMTTSQTPHEKKQMHKLGIPLGLLVIIPLVFSLVLDSQQITFWQAFIHFYVLFTIVSLADLIILDWLIFCLITPKFIVIPGTEGAKGYKNYLFHFIGFLKGCVILAVLSFLLSSIRIAATWL
ncbi:nitroreductase [Paenibacillus sp. D2_2]|uniref:nitroreductase n=1 Tax=Paenibacillus sp. D2_2 TaxID=3073092 RepID=UPI0028168377|nr:nitroreductase [Paenibacillus sp. D2_2]WMT43098.1 nitroreductase [Paenibacillus sp. D2_2]